MSNSQNDAFDRLKNRPRATVPARNKSLTDSNNDVKTEISHSVKTEISQDVIAEVEACASSSDDRVTLTEPALSQDIQAPEAVRRTLRIDGDIDLELEQLCGKAKITRETFLEAAYLACTQNSDLMSAVLLEAQQRYRDRKQVGERRKFETMRRRLIES
jgi:hypothetical protein